MYILGISAYYHDSAVALVRDGKIIAAAQEERFTRIKNDSSFPIQACRYCLSAGGIKVSDLSAVVFYDKPFLKFERLLETYYESPPKGLHSFVKAMPVWLKDKLHLKRNIYKQLTALDKSTGTKRIELLFSEHHLSHAASAYYPSPFDNAVMVTMDGAGEWATTSISIGNGTRIRMLKEVHFPDSVGLLYSSFTAFLGFKVNSGEYKLMGLAPYGNENSPQTKQYIRTILNHLVFINMDGSFHLNHSYFSYMYGLKMVKEKRWEELFGITPRKPESQITQAHCNLAFAIQHVTEQMILQLVSEARKLTDTENLCLAGGVALNCVANGKILKSNMFKNVYVPPAPDDAGGAIGAALAAWYLKISPKEKIKEGVMRGSYLGPQYTDKETKEALRLHGLSAIHFVDTDQLTKQVAHQLVEGKIVGWFQGRMEFGPRALGNRSILADPRYPDIHQIINAKVKFRENFRPFAPAVLVEDYQEYFDLSIPSPYMSIVATLKDKLSYPLPSSYRELPLQEKIVTPRSILQAITHVDLSARIQTVAKDTNPLFHQLLRHFKEITGSSVLLNTSFNVRGEPIVCTPEEAILTFRKAALDILVLNNYLIIKT